MIVVTGAAGFIGSCMIGKLNQENFNYIVAVDDFSNAAKNKNLSNKKIKKKVHRNDFFSWLELNQQEVEFIIHLGARTNTAEFDLAVLRNLNFEYSRQIWQACCHYYIPLIYASSAATYGIGNLGYDDNEAVIPKLQPLNPYGHSKNNFDIWALAQKKEPFFWAGLKFFNVYGPNEYHKDRMASVVFHAFNQIQRNNTMQLFRSHHPDFSDGEQKRDFIYIKDVMKVIMFLLHHRKNSGIYNLGSGKARTFLDLARITSQSMQKQEQIDFIDTPEDIRGKYQYFTEANMQKLKNIGYNKPFHSLEDGIDDYVRNYLSPHLYF